VEEMGTSRGRDVAPCALKKFVHRTGKVCDTQGAVLSRSGRETEVFEVLLVIVYPGLHQRSDGENGRYDSFFLKAERGGKEGLAVKDDDPPDIDILVLDWARDFNTIQIVTNGLHWIIFHILSTCHIGQVKVIHLFGEEDREDISLLQSQLLSLLSLLSLLLKETDLIGPTGSDVFRETSMNSIL
jgi:hypothetical protein